MVKSIGQFLMEDIEIPEEELDLFEETEPTIPSEFPEEKPAFVNPPFIPA